MKKLLMLLLTIGLLTIPSFNTSALRAFGAPEEMYEGNGEDESPDVVCVDVYDFKLRLKVPQVLNNSLSTGYRKYKSQIIKGNLYVNWMSDDTVSITFGNLVNSTFKVGGKNVIYTTYDAGYQSNRLNWIGNNKTDMFKTPCLSFSSVFEPSYAIGEADEDNSFYLLFAGAGTSKAYSSSGIRVAKTFRGYAVGTQGCSCYAYGHKSPTRAGSVCGPSDRVDDAVATFGNWSAKFNRRVSCR